jgi:hypothetical protein
MLSPSGAADARSGSKADSSERPVLAQSGRCMYRKLKLGVVVVKSAKDGV